MMRMARGIIVAGIAVLLFSAVSHAQEGKIGYLNLSKAFDEHNKTKDFDRALDAEGKEKTEMREKMVDEIRRLKDEMELLSESGRSNKQQVIDDKVKALQQFDTETRQMMRKKRDDMVGEILNEIKEAVTDYGRKNNYSIILNDRVVLYSDGKDDITDDIIREVNK